MMIIIIWLLESHRADKKSPGIYAMIGAIKNSVWHDEHLQPDIWPSLLYLWWMFERFDRAFEVWPTAAIAAYAIRLESYHAAGKRR